MARRGGDERARAQFVERFGAALVEAGVPNMAALVFAALLATDDGGLTADELAAQLQVSRGAVSGALGYLDQAGLTTRERQAGTRRYRHVLRDPSRYEMVARRERILDRWIAATREGVDALGPATPAGRRLAESLGFFEFLREEMPAMLERWRARDVGGRGRTPS
jgi:DNA-binding transcriptional regulator GbsR (MarR family)